MNDIDQESKRLQEELDKLITTALEQPGVAELLDIISSINEIEPGQFIETQEFHFIGSTSSMEYQP